MRYRFYYCLIYKKNTINFVYITKQYTGLFLVQVVQSKTKYANTLAHNKNETLNRDDYNDDYYT